MFNPPPPPPSFHTSTQHKRRLSEESRGGPLTYRMRELHLQDDWQPLRPTPMPRHRLTQATQDSSPPAWGQIKKLTNEAERLVLNQGLQPSPFTLFVAILAILACQAKCDKPGTSYWAYLPNPPSFQRVTWENEVIPLYTNIPSLMGGAQSPIQLGQAVNTKNFSFYGVSSSVPICFVIPNTIKDESPSINGCAPTSYKGVLRDSPNYAVADKRLLWSLILLLPGDSSPKMFTPKDYPKALPVCAASPPEKDDTNEEWAFVNPKIGFPKWRYCAYKKEIHIVIPGTYLTVIDRSCADSSVDYRLFLESTNVRYSWKNEYIPRRMPINRWHINGWVPSILTISTKKGRIFSI
ncbi:uncharacterized protein LOC131507511 isoform X2 [Neofelis nebulosa]|nr:uncharacterized protein LOC131507511 isoform X2 [Neofelis nebulosa]XP_058578373.1 uncharacterized protein LOC131507511 isoform X2 [Neofelis nebulosa]XP_058578374.1 uncharacterized protein LOC131507511 isoform X2 [Neofelis nebulosa]XP_058578376.1 uncharacterized protein LOC131507511 isoform X2 [Neofelis nebulosa]XP_058578377.1 uncharacterized protein LOC131507511 isoform X2 [Neofelis nebulosa]